MGSRLLFTLLLHLFLAAPLCADILYVKSMGDGDDRLSLPMDVAVGYEGRIYTADSGNNRVVVFDSTGAISARIGFAGSGEGRFQDPVDVGAGEGLHLYVLDAGNERVQLFDRFGQFSEIVLSRDEETIGAPAGLTVDPFGRLYVADDEDDKVHVFRSYTGEEEFSIGGYGTKRGRFRSPADIAVDRARRIYVTDRVNNSVQVFHPLGGFLFSIGGGEGPALLRGPTGIAVDLDGYIFVADTRNDRIAVFDATGIEVDEIREYGTGLPLHAPRGVAVGAAGVLYVSDTENNLLHMFRYRF